MSEELRYRALLALDARAPQSLAALVDGLHDESWRVRKAAVEQLARAAERGPTVARLIDVLGERGQPGARNAAAEALVRLGEASVGPLVALLEHPDPDQRKFAADILGELGRAEAVPALLAALGREEPNVQLAAAEALSRIGGERAAPALRELLSHPSALLRLAALEGLYALRQPPPLDALTPLLAEPRLRRSAYRLLGLVRERGAVERVCHGVLAESRPARSAALGALWAQHARADAAGRTSLKEALRGALQGRALALEEALASGELEVRGGALVLAAALPEAKLAPALVGCALEEGLAEQACAALVALGAPAAQELVRRLPELSSAVRGALASVLVEVADPSVLEPLAALARGAEADLRPWAVKALGRSRAARAAPGRGGLHEDKDVGFVAARALVALHAAEPAAVGQVLAAALEGPQPAPAAQLASVLVGGVAAVAALKALARHPEAAVRAEAAEAAGELPGEAALPFVQLGLADEAPAVRRAAVRALSRGDAAELARLLKLALGDDDEGVRKEAAEAAGRTRCVAVAPELSALVAGHGQLASAAVRALGRMERFSAAQLTQAARHPDPEVVKAALVAGGHHPEVRALAVELLRHGRWDVRTGAARALTVVGSSASGAEGDALRRALALETDPLARAELERAAAELQARGAR